MTAAMPILYSGPFDPYSHRCRIVIAEKKMTAEIREVDLARKPEELALYNPYNRVPVLVDREVRLYESTVINEYLDDRFPHPQLMPVDIVRRAKTRLLLYQMDRELFPHLDTLMNRKSKRDRRESAGRRIVENLTRLAEVMPKTNKYILSNDFTLLDASLAPLLWRLEHYGVRMPRAPHFHKYAERVFSREGFIDSLTVLERAMRK